MRKSLILTLLAALCLLAAAPRAAQAAGSTFSGCPPSSPSPGIIDNGCTQHAQGPIFGNMYTVIWGDTVFSISRRFNVNGDYLMQFNGIPSPYRLLAGQPIRIPGGGPDPRPCPTPFLSITTPTPGASVGTTFAVSGSGCGLFEGNVVIRALDSRGVQVGEAVTTLSGPNVGIGGQGTYNVTLTVPGAQGQMLTLIATSSGVEYSRVMVNLNNGGVGTCASAALSIFEPAEGVNVPASFTVRGDAAFNCSVTVTARDGGGRQVGTAPPAGTFQGTQWATTLTLQGGIAPGTDLFIEARTNGGGTALRRVRFGNAPPPVSLTITEPGQNASLSVTFWVRGNGTGLGDGRIIVQAIGNSQGVITQQETTVGPSGQGAFALQLTVALNTPGRIEAFNPATGQRATVDVIFNGGSSGASYRDLFNGQCSLFIPNNNVPAFTNPDGTQVRTLPGGWMATRRVVRFGGQLWYVIPGSGTGGLDEWVRGNDVQPSGTCGL